MQAFSPAAADERRRRPQMLTSPLVIATATWKNRPERVAQPTTRTNQSIMQQDDPHPHRLHTALEAGLGIPFTAGNRVTALRNGREIFPAMLEAIDRAERTVDFLTFVYWTGDIAQRFAAALIGRARAGVRVQVILDAVGAAPMPRDLIDEMRGAGIEVVWFRPPVRWKLWQSDNRTHRKVLVCDGRVGFVGGAGIAAEWEGDARGPREWRDTHFRIEGPAVRGLQAAFVGEWAETGRPVTGVESSMPELPPVGDSLVQVVRSSASIGWSDINTLFQLAIHLARRRLRIATAYLVPGDQVTRLLCEAARRGVDVALMVPGAQTDHRVVRWAGRPRYEPLIEAGVGVLEYQRTMLHAKVCTVDHELAIVGSANLNQRSLARDDELVCAVLDRGLVEILDRHFDEDAVACTAVEHAKLSGRGLAQRARERAARLLKPQL